MSAAQLDPEVSFFKQLPYEVHSQILNCFTDGERNDLLVEVLPHKECHQVLLLNNVHFWSQKIPWLDLDKYPTWDDAFQHVQLLKSTFNVKTVKVRRLYKKYGDRRIHESTTGRR